MLTLVRVARSCSESLRLLSRPFLAGELRVSLDRMGQHQLSSLIRRLSKFGYSNMGMSLAITCTHFYGYAAKSMYYTQEVIAVEIKYS